VVLLLPMIYTLRLNYPTARMDIVIRAGLADLLRPVKELDTIIEYDKKSAGETFRLLKRLKEQRYDIAFLPHRSLRTALLATLARIPRRIGFNRGGGRWLHTARVEYRYGVHEIERNFDLLKAAGISRFPDDYRYRDLDQFGVAPVAITDPGGTGCQPYVVISPGSQWGTKRWPMERYRELAERISVSHGVTLVITGTTRETALGAAIAEPGRAGCQRIDSKRVMNLCGATDLAALMAVIRNARLLIARSCHSLAPWICSLNASAMSEGLVKKKAMLEFHLQPKLLLIIVKEIKLMLLI